MRAPTSVLVWTSEAPDPKTSWRPRIPAVAEGSPYDDHGMDRRHHSHFCGRCHHEHSCSAPLRMVVKAEQYVQLCDDPSPLWLDMLCCNTAGTTGGS